LLAVSWDYLKRRSEATKGFGYLVYLLKGWSVQSYWKRTQ